MHVSMTIFTVVVHNNSFTPLKFGACGGLELHMSPLFAVLCLVLLRSTFSNDSRKSFLAATNSSIIRWHLPRYFSPIYRPIETFKKKTASSPTPSSNEPPLSLISSWPAIIYNRFDKDSSVWFVSLTRCNHLFPYFIQWITSKFPMSFSYGEGVSSFSHATIQTFHLNFDRHGFKRFRLAV